MCVFNLLLIAGSLIVPCCFAISSETMAYVLREQNLRNRLIDECKLDLQIRPVVHYEDPVKIAPGLQAVKFREINSRDQTFSMLGYFDFTWQHPCAKWNDSSEWSDIRSFVFPVDKTWTPLIQHSNSADQVIIGSSPERGALAFKKSGVVTWTVAETITSFCLFKLDKFPFDQQTCTVEIELWFSTLEQDFYFETSEPINVNHDTFMDPNSVWSHVTNNASLQGNTYPGYGSRVYQNVIFSFTFKRRYESYVTSLFLPCFILAFLQICSGFMPPEMPDRSGFCITILLAYAVSQSLINELTPTTSQTPYIVILLAFLLVVCLVCTLYALVTCELATRKKFQQKIAIIQGKFAIKCIRLLDLAFYSSVSLITILAFVISFARMLI